MTCKNGVTLIKLRFFQIPNYNEIGKMQKEKPNLFFLNRFYNKVLAARAFVLLLCYFSFLQMLLLGSSGIRIIGHLQEEKIGFYLRQHT